MRPPPCWRISGTAASTQRNDARRSTPSCSSHAVHVELVERHRAVERRHVDEHVEPAEFPADGLDHRRARGRIAQVGLERQRAAADLANRRRRLVGFRARSVVGKRDVRATLSDRRRNRGADALRAGQEDDAIGQEHRQTSYLSKRIEARRAFSTRVSRPASATSSSAPAAGAREREWSAAGCDTLVENARSKRPSRSSTSSPDARAWPPRPAGC